MEKELFEGLENALSVLTVMATDITRFNMDEREKIKEVLKMLEFEYKFELRTQEIWNEHLELVNNG